LVAGGYSQAQNIKLKKGQTLNISTSTVQSIDMGMGGQMENNSKSNSVIEVTDLDKGSYFTTTKLNKLVLNMEGMGQSQRFDSDNPEDKNSEMGKTLGEAIGKEVKVTVDNGTGKIMVAKPADPEKPKEENPLEGLMSMFGDAERDGAMVDVVFLVVPQGKKAGDSWSDSTEMRGKSRVFKTYTIKEISGELAKIGLVSNMAGATSTEANGMQIDVNIKSKSDGEILVDPKTSIVKKINQVTDIEGTMDVMGQSMPIISKVTLEIVIK